jgi:DNA polymerase-3 subunit epsilon
MAYFAFDVETTGLEPGYHEILQIGAILLNDKLEECGSGSAKLWPKHWGRADKKALEINKVDPKMWKPTHESTKKALDKIILFIYKHVPPHEKINLMGHNVTGFDIQMLKALFKEEGVTWVFHYHPLDTIVMAKTWSLVTGENLSSLRLCDLCDKFGVVNNKEHDAMGDARASVELARKIVEDLKTKRSMI